MDELLQEFLNETGENLDTVDRELVRFEQEPNNRDILRNIFRLVHTVKGTCGFIGLPRLEALTHAAESVMGQLRDGASVSAIAVTTILETIDRVKDILAELADKGTEPSGNDDLLIAELMHLAGHAKRELAAAGHSHDDPVAAYLARHADPVAAAAEVGETDLIFVPAPELPRMAAEPRDREQAPDKAPTRESRQTGPATLRVNVDTIEHLMTMVSELVLTRNQLLDIVRRQDDSELKVPLQRLSLITAELQDGVMKTRMQPIGNAWSKLPRIVRDLSADLGKRIELVLEGADTELDRQVLDMIKDPLIHMVRNCADHAIESPEARRALGKPEQGTIRVKAYHEGGAVTISVSDDGRGLDIARIRRKAIYLELATEAEIAQMTDVEIGRFIFHPGFSTTDQVTAISGRGVGMDVVKANVDQIGGRIDIVSVTGQGATLTIKIPLTLAIVAALIFVSGEHRFAIPQAVVRELVRVKAFADHRIEQINGAPVLRLRDRLLPIIALGELMGSPAQGSQDGFIVVTQIGDRQFGLLVDHVFHTEEIVVKPLSSKLRQIPFFSGSTILGDGAVVLIIDPNGIARLVGALGSVDAGASAPGTSVATAGDERTTMLVFRAGSEGIKAVPLSLVTRLEEVQASQFEAAGDQVLLNYRGRLIPVIPVAGASIRRDGLQPLVIVSDGPMTMALAVDIIVDIVEEVLDIELRTTLDSGVIGSALIRGRATEILDLAHYLPQGGLAQLRRRTPAESQGAARVLLVEPSAFLRDMLIPVLKATGHQIAHATDIAAARPMALPETGDILIDLDRQTDAALAFGQELRKSRELRKGGEGDVLRIIGLTTCATHDLSQRAAQSGFDLVVAKFDRRGLLAGLAETDARQAA